MKFRLTSYILLSLIFISCSTSKQTLPYMENLPEAQQGSMGKSQYSIRIVPDDELLITVNSANPLATSDYNLPLITSSVAKEDLTNFSTVQKTIQTYIVDKNGDITFPLLGKIHVVGMTIEQLRNYLTEKISADVKDPIVRVALVNFHVNVMGEVKNPQTIEISTERFSVMDALASAGDMTEYGRRDNVLVIRETADGEKLYKRLNLKDPSIVTDPFFYLQQNDVVYVEPNDIRKGNSRYDQYNSFKIQIISTIISAASVITSLVISLTR